MQAIAITGLGDGIPRGYTQPVGTVGRNIVQMREGLSLSQAELADRLKVRQPSVWKLENNQGLPHTATLFKVAKALNCRVEALLEGIDAEYDALRADLIGRDGDQQSGHDSASARILKLETDVRRYQTALSEVQDVANQLIQIAAVGHEDATATGRRSGRGRRDRKTG